MRTYLKLSLWILGIALVFASILKLDGLARLELGASILPFAILGAGVLLALIYLAIKTKRAPVKLALSYLTILPLCLIVSEGFFYYKRVAQSTQVQPHAILGTSNAKDSITRKTLIVDDKLIYDVVYTNDKNSLRTTPHNIESSKKARKVDSSAIQCINIYGGSFVYGDGLSDSQTITAMLSTKLPGFQANNFGISGGGGHQMLARLEFELDSSVLEKCTKHIFIYEIIPHHLYRALGVFGGPKYALDSNGQATYIANHFSPSDLARFSDESQSRFTLAQRLANQLEKSYTKQFITTPNSSAKSTEEMLAIFPSGYASNAYYPSIKEQDFALYFAIVAKIQALLRERYNAPLYVLVWDYDMHAQFLDKYDSLIQKRLAQMGIEFWKISEILGLEYKQDLERVKRGELESFAYRISRWDTHPNARANEQIAEFIAAQITRGEIQARAKSGF